MIKPKIIDKINQNMRAGGIYSPRRPITFLKTFYSRTRTHFSLVHYSTALFPFALIAQLLNIWKGGNENLQWTSSFLTICGTIMLIPAILSGITSFSINFKKQIRGNLNIKLKIICTPFLIIFAVSACILSINPATAVNAAYTTLLSMIFVIMIIMEVNGKKLTFKDFARKI